MLTRETEVNKVMIFSLYEIYSLVPSNANYGCLGAKNARGDYVYSRTYCTSPVLFFPCDLCPITEQIE
jgi:hypothetical protein